MGFVNADTVSVTWDDGKAALIGHGMFWLKSRDEDWAEVVAFQKIVVVADAFEYATGHAGDAIIECLNADGTRYHAHGAYLGTVGTRVDAAGMVMARHCELIASAIHKLPSAEVAT